MAEVRHLSMEEQLTLRDGEASAWAREHAAACTDCAAELYRLEQMRSRLRALPSLGPPRDRWPEVARLVRSERRRRWSSGVTGLAAAAALVGLLLVSMRGPREDRAAMDGSDLRAAMAQSEDLERALRALQPERRALRGDAASVVAALQDRLAGLDASLGDPAAWQTSPDRVVRLWRERVGLLSALVDVHTARVAVAGL